MHLGDERVATEGFYLLLHFVVLLLLVATEILCLFGSLETVLSPEKEGASGYIRR